MSPIEVAVLTFACVFGGALAGMALRGRIPTDHLSSEAKDVVKLGSGLIATMAALVLGLLTASAKSAFDAETAAVKQTATDLILLDRTLARVGPEAGPLRKQLRQTIGDRVQAIWPASGASAPHLEAPTASPGENLLSQLQALPAADDHQRQLLAKAAQLGEEVLKNRWLMFTQAASSSIPLPFLIVVVFWLALVFSAFGLLSGPNPTVAAVLALSALSVAGALFLILEMDSPFSGLLKISPDALHYALEQIGR